MSVKNFDVPFLDAKGQPVIEKEKAVLVRDIAAGAIWTTQQEDATLSIKDRNNLGSLAMRIEEGGPRQYTTEELALIQKRAMRTASNIAFLRLSEVIDGPDATVEEKTQAVAVGS